MCFILFLGALWCRLDEVARRSGTVEVGNLNARGGGDSAARLIGSLLAFLLWMKERGFGQAPFNQSDNEKRIYRTNYIFNS